MVRERGLDYFYSTPAIEQRLDLLAHLIEFGHQPVVLTGLLGAGKSALLEEMLARAPESWRVAVIDQTANSLDSLSLLLATEWGIEVDEHESVVDAVQHQVDRWIKEEQVPVAVLDDAHLVPEAVLNALLTLFDSGGERGRGRVRVIMAGEPELEARLARPRGRVLQGGLAHCLEMPALEVDDVNDYLLGRQQASGLAGVRLPPEAAARLHAETRGLPGPMYDRFIRAVAAVAASEAEPARSVARAPSLSAPAVRRYATVMAAVALVFVGSLIWRALSHRAANEGEAPGPALSVIETLTLPPQTPVPVAPPTVAITQLAEAGAQPQPVPLPVAPVVAPPAAATAPATLPPLVEPEAQVDAANAAAEDAAPPGLEELTPRPSDPSPVAETPAATPTATETPATTPVAAVEPAPAPAATEPEKPDRPTQPEAPEAPAPAVKDDSDWLRSRAAGDHVLQVLASNDQAAARSAMTRLKLGASGRLFSIRRDGKPWYVVVYGVYPDRASASAALARLPAALKALKPFPKSVGSLRSSGAATP